MRHGPGVNERAAGVGMRVAGVGMRVGFGSTFVLLESGLRGGGGEGE